MRKFINHPIQHISLFDDKSHLSMKIIRLNTCLMRITNFLKLVLVYMIKLWTIMAVGIGTLKTKAGFRMNLIYQARHQKIYGFLFSFFSIFNNKFSYGLKKKFIYLNPISNSPAYSRRKSPLFHTFDAKTPFPE